MTHHTPNQETSNQKGQSKVNPEAKTIGELLDNWEALDAEEALPELKDLPPRPIEL